MGYYEVLAVNHLNYLLGNLVVWITLAASEEIVFRGIVYRIVEENLGTVLALILSTLLFSIRNLAERENLIPTTCKISILEHRCNCR